MDFNTIIDELAVGYSMTGNEHLLADLLDILTPAIKAKARNYNSCVPSVTREDFEGLLRESVWKACRNGSLSNFDSHRGHVMPRIYHYWRFALIDAARKAQRRLTVSLDTLPTCPPALTAQMEDLVSITQELQRFRRLRPMDYAVISALIDGADTKELARLFGRSEYDGYARMRVSRARKAFGSMLCG